MFLGFSIISAVLGGIIVTLYSTSIVAGRGIKEYFTSQSENSLLFDQEFLESSLKNYHAEMDISTAIMVLGIAEIVFGIWAAICCSVMNPFARCNEVSQQVWIPEEGNKNTLHPVTLSIKTSYLVRRRKLHPTPPEVRGGLKEMASLFKNISTPMGSSYTFLHRISNQSIQLSKLESCEHPLIHHFVIFFKHIILIAY